MSDSKIEALEIGLYEDYLEELQKKYYGGINKVLNEPWFTKTDAEMEEDGPIGAGIETVRTSTLREGHELWSDLNNTDGALLLSAGTILTQAQVEKIRSMSELGKLHDTYEIKNAN